jgi:hypothetical protein
MLCDRLRFHAKQRPNGVRNYTAVKNEIVPVFESLSVVSISRAAGPENARCLLFFCEKKMRLARKCDMLADEQTVKKRKTREQRRNANRWNCRCWVHCKYRKNKVRRAGSL